MINQRGFTLVELMIVIVIVLIVLSVIAGAVGSSSSNSNISWGINGMTESRCIDGYRFIVSQDGSARQILDEFGKGARCEKLSIPGGQ